MKSFSENLLEKLKTLAEEALPHEEIRNAYFQACEHRDALNRKIFETPRWEDAKESHSEMAEVLKQVEHLFCKKADAERAILRAWAAVIDTFSAASNDIRLELDALAGPEIEIGGVHITSPTLIELTEKLVQIQVECLGENHRGHFHMSAILGRKIIGTLEDVVRAVPKIQPEAQALAAAATTYNQTLAA